QILSAPLLAEILRMHGEKLSARALRRSYGGVTAPCLPVGDGGPHCRTARVQSAAQRRAQLALFDAAEQPQSFRVLRGARHNPKARIDAIGPRQTECRTCTLLGARARHREYPEK